MKTTLLTIPLLSLLGANLIAQAPGAHGTVTPGVTGAPSQRRENPGAASDTRMYVFGGRSGNSGGLHMNDLWEFDGKTWVELTKDGAAGSPPQRDQAGITWDFTRNKLIVFGGNTAAGMLNDTWEFDPIAKAWKDITPTAGSPTARSFHKIAHDPTTGAIILFGGLTPTAHLNDTWMFSGGTTWTQLSPSGVPATRRQHHLVRRSDYQDILLFGGQDVNLPKPTNFRTDTWRFVGLNWVQITTPNLPTSVVANEAAYDPIRRRAVMIGGNSITGASPTGEINEFDSVANDWVTRWSNTTPDPVLGKISRYFLAYLPTTGKIYKISGQGGIAGVTTTVEYQSDKIATATIGSPGCAGTGGTPVLSANVNAWIGRTMEVEVDKAPANAATLMGLGFAPTTIPLSLLGIGAANCVITVDPLLVFVAVPNSSGKPSFSVPVPNLPAVLTAPPILIQAVVTSGGVSIVSNRLDMTGGAL